MHKGLIVAKHSNQIIPAAFLALAIKEFPGSFGAAVVTKDNAGEQGFISLKMPKAADMDGLDQLQETFMDDAAILFFGTSTNKNISPESLQPFDLLMNKDGEPLLVGFIEGTFPGYGEEKSAHSEAYFVVEKYLRSKLAKIYRYAQGDMKLVLDELRDPTFKQEIENTMTQRGQVTLLSITNEVITFGEKNTSLIQFPWGWASQSCGYTEQQTPDTSKKKEEPKSAIAQMVSRKTQAKVDTPAPTPAPSEKKSNTVPNIAAPVTDTALKVQPRMFQASKSLHGKKLRRSYQTNAGFIPDNYASYPEVESRVHQTLADIQPSQIKTVEPSPSARDNKDTTPHHVQAKSERPAAEKVAPPVKPTIYMPLLQPETKGAVHKAFNEGKLSKVLDKNSQEIPSPSEIQKMEKKFPDFAKQTGMAGLEPTFQWEYNAVFHALDKEALAVLWFSTRSALLSAYTEQGVQADRIRSLEAQVAGAATKQTKPTVTSTKADPEPEPAPAPVKAATTGLMSHMVSRKKVA